MDTLEAKAWYSSSVDYNPRTVAYEQDGNYVEYVEDGENTFLPKYNVVFTEQLDAGKEIYAFLKAKKGLETFKWKETGTANTYSFTCEKLGVSIEDGRITITAEFQRQPEYVAPSYLTLDGTWVLDGTYVLGVN